MEKFQLHTGDCISVGIDIGSTTAKIVAVDNGTVLFECYERHLSMVRKKALELLEEPVSVL